jgi:hypothetical protein
MRRVLLVLALIITAPPVFARGGGETAIANDTTTSMGEPIGSPSYAAPRSAIVPGTPAHQRALELGEDPALVARCGTFHPERGCHPAP